VAPPPKLKTLRPEDYDFNGEASEWGPKLLQVLSTFCSDVTNALSKNLTRGENLRGGNWELNFTTGGTVAIDTAPFPKFITPQFKVDPKNFHLWITDIRDTTDSTDTSPSGGVSPCYRLTSNGMVEVRLISGLDANRTYVVRGLME
jgi:hypothetical protein